MDKINKIKIKDVTYEIGGGGSATVDSGLSTTSENAVQNKVITGELEKKLDKSNFQTTLNSVVATYKNFGGADTGGTVPMLHIKDNLATSAFTVNVKDKEQLCKLVGVTGSTQGIYPQTGLYVVFKASDLDKLKTNFTNGNTFDVAICMNPSSAQSHLATNILEDLVSGESMLGKTYIKSVTDYDNIGSVKIITTSNKIYDTTFESLYATYSGDTSTMFCAYWGNIRDAFKTSSSPSFAINGGSDTSNIYIYSSSIVSYRDMSDPYGRDKEGYYVKFIDKKDLGYQGESVDINSSLDYMYGAADLTSMKTDISNNKTKIGKLSNLASEVVYAEPDTADSAHTFTRTINGYNIYTTDKDNRDMKVVKSINGKNGNKYGEVFIYAIVNGVDAISTDTSVKLDVRGDWNMNFKGDRHYIYNRPFYQEDPTYGDPIYLFKGTDYSQCYCTNTTLQKDIAEGVLEAPFQDYTCYKEGNNYIVKKTEHISNPPSSAYGYWSGTTLTSGSSWTSNVANAMGPEDMENHANNNFYVRPEIEGVIHKLDNKFIQAKTINGESVLGEGEIDMSLYQTKAESVKIARLTQAEYDALSTKDNNTLYIITDAQ